MTILDDIRGSVEMRTCHEVGRILQTYLDGELDEAGTQAVEAKLNVDPAMRAEAEKFESSAQEWGYRIGSQVYSVYLAGRVKQSGLRRLFLAHLDQPGVARKVCTAVIAKIRAASK